MVTKNGHQNGLEMESEHFGTNLRRLTEKLT